MGHSSPVQAEDQHGHRISGVAVVIALLLTAVCGAGLAVAMFLATPRVPPAQLEAFAKADRTAATASGDPHSAGPAAQPPAPPPADEHLAEVRAAPQTPAASSPTFPSSPGLSPDAGGVSRDSSHPLQGSDQSGIDVTTLTPIEVQAAVAGRDAWRRSVTIGGRAYDRAVSLRPATDQGTTQIAFELGARYASLRGVAGIADPSLPSRGDSVQDRPQAVFRVYGDGNLLWESKPLAGRVDPQAFECTVAGVDVVTFVAESQSPANISDLAWAGLRAFSGEKKPETSVPPRSP